MNKPSRLIDRQLARPTRLATAIGGLGLSAVAVLLIGQLVTTLQATVGSPALTTLVAAITGFVGSGLLLTAWRGRWHPMLAGIFELVMHWGDG